MKSAEDIGRFLRERKALAAVVSVGAASLLGVGIGIGIERQISGTHHGVLAEGTVECASGRHIEGVWIQTMDDPGWAAWSSNPQQKSIASYGRRLPNDEIYGVHVGCGGSPANWTSSNFSPGVSTEETPDFICYDTPEVSTARHRLGSCAVASVG